MTPDEIEVAEFFVGMRGYEKSEVRDFLTRVAEEHRSLLSRIAALESAPPAPVQTDPIEELGRHVMEVVRTAQEAGSALVAEAEQAAADVRAAAELEARRVANDAAAITEAAAAQRAEADRLLAHAREEGERLVAAARERGQAEADEVVARAEQRQAEILGACDEMLNRLHEAVTGAQMSLLVLRPEAEAAPTAPTDDLPEPATVEHHDPEHAPSEP